MSSYQQNYLGGIDYDASRPDFLTCGYCAKEFMLANITLFIAHKAVGCNPNVDKMPQESVQDTSSPLTCSFCSRVFLTARGLLQHAEEDHNMCLCIKKGPLIIPDNCCRPPPAHFSNNSLEDDSISDRNCCKNDDRPQDQPTDLSMSCRNMLGKATIQCSEGQCKIVLKPLFTSASSIGDHQSTLTEKPGFGDGQSSRIDSNSSLQRGHEASFDPLTLSSDNGYLREEDIQYNNDATSKRLDDETIQMQPYQMKSDPEVFITAKYDKERLCCVSISTEKSIDRGDNDRVENSPPLNINGKVDGEGCNVGREVEECGGPTTSKLIYKLPKQMPSFPESAKPLLVKSSVTEGDCSFSSNQNVITTARDFSATTAQSNLVYSHSSSTVFPVSTSVSPTTLHYNNVEQTPNPLPPLPQPPQAFNEFNGFYSDGNSEQLLPSSMSDDVIDDEFQILNMSTRPFSNSVTPNVPLPTSRPQIAKPPTPLTPKSILRVLQSPFDFDMSPIPDGSSLENINTAIGGAPTLGDGSEVSIPYETSTGTSSNSIHTSTKMSLQSSLDELSILANHRPPQGTDTVAIKSEVFVNKSKDTSVKQGLVQNETESKSVVGDKNCSYVVTTQNDSYEVMTQNGSYEVMTQNGSFEVMTQNGSYEGMTHDPVERSELEDTSRQINTKKSVQKGDHQRPQGARQLKKRRYPTSKPFQCSHCDQAFNQRIHLKKHMSKHTGLKPFKCQHCDYSTVERSHLKVHFRVHTGEKPFKCMFCDYATAQNSTLKIHLRRHHEGIQNWNEQQTSGHEVKANIRRKISPNVTDNLSTGPTSQSLPKMSSNSNLDKNISVTISASVDDARHDKKSEENGPISMLNLLSEISIATSQIQMAGQSPSKQASNGDHLVSSNVTNDLVPRKEWYAQTPTNFLGENYVSISSGSTLESVHPASGIDETACKTRSKINSPQIKRILSGKTGDSKHVISTLSTPSHLKVLPSVNSAEIMSNATVPNSRGKQNMSSEKGTKLIEIAVEREDFMDVDMDEDKLAMTQTQHLESKENGLEHG